MANSQEQTRLLDFEAADWLLPIAGIVLAAIFAAIFGS
jgi:hypothetical protein